MSAIPDDHSPSLVPLRGELRIQIGSTPLTGTVCTADEILAMRPACARAARRAYTTNPELARAFVDGILESGCTRDRALDVIQHHCAELQIDDTLLIEALGKAHVEGRAA